MAKIKTFENDPNFPIFGLEEGSIQVIEELSDEGENETGTIIIN